MKLVIQIPCYNEEKSLPITLNDLPKHIDGIDEIEVLIIDDGSKDRTVEVAKELGVNNFVEMSHNSGLAKAFVAGINKALEIGADIVIGSRPVSEIEHFSPLKKLLQKLGSGVMRLISSTKVEDAPSGFRAFSRNAAMQLNVFDNYTYTLETIIQAKAKGLILKCVPIRVNPDWRKSKLVRNMFDYIRRSMFTMIRMFIIYRPFRFFAILASMFFLVGALIGLRFLYYFVFESGAGHIQSLILSAILIITGVQVGVIAVLSELLSINRKILEDIQKRLKLQDLQKK